MTTKIQEWHDVDRDLFESTIFPQQRPAVMRNLVGDWLAIEKANTSDESIAEWLCNLDSKKPATAIVGSPEIKGRFSYSADFRGHNFQSIGSPVSQGIGHILAQEDSDRAHAIALQSVPIRDCLPAFEEHNPMPLLSDEVGPTMWLGNRAFVAPHYDASDNIACVVAGQRKFTLFPPEQIANLYVGPMLNAPGGVPISLVDYRQPDYQRFPKFKIAEENAQQATLEKGDAIFIPTPWWHGVESLQRFNVLVNYWWRDKPFADVSPNHSLLQALLIIPHLPRAQRAAWRAFFDELVFRLDGNPTEHLPDKLEDALTNMNAEQKTTVSAFLQQQLKLS